MTTRIFGMLWALALVGSAQAALVITSDDNGSQSIQYFDAGTFLQVEDGQPTFGATASGDCWFVEDGQRVIGKCEQMLETMRDFREQAMAGLSPADRKAMEQYLQAQRAASAVEVVSKGTRTVAGYQAECSTINGTRELCTARDLMRDVENEMDGSAFLQFQQRMNEMTEKPGMSGDDSAVARLFERGYPVYDKSQQSMGIPGLDPAMLQMLPEDKRRQIMAQIQASGGGGAMQGSEVISVDRNGKMPVLQLDHLPTVGFDEYAQRMMGSMGGARSR